MAKASTGRGSSKSSGGGSKKTTMDKIAKAAMSREMLAAGLTAAAAAIAASPKARKAIRGTRGRFTLLDRAKVEKSACECYALLRGDVEVMTRDIAGAWNG